jgi:hypothetical protein
VKKLLVMGILLLGVVGCDTLQSGSDSRAYCHRLADNAKTSGDTVIVRITFVTGAQYRCGEYLDADKKAGLR